jgi:hypothetical protein
VTGRDGLYSLTDVPPGDYAVEAKSTGFATYKSEISLKPGPVDLNIPLDLGYFGDFNGPPYVVEGVVTGPDGKPLEGAAIVAVSPFDKKVWAKAWSRRAGLYRVGFGRPAGQCVVIASKEGYRAEVRIIMARGAGPKVNFQLARLSRGKD